MKGIYRILLALTVVSATVAGAIFGFITNTKYENVQKSNSVLQTENDDLKKANSYLKDQIFELETKLNKKESEVEETKEVAKKEEVKKVSYVTVPNLEGVRLREVDDFLDEFSLKLGDIVFEICPVYENVEGSGGKIWRQDFAPGKKVPAGTEIGVTVHEEN